MKRPLILIGVLVFLAACNERTERKEGFGVHGIDVSHYQKQVNWPLVAAQDVKFAFVKATEGQSMQDTLFCQNWDAMRAAGVMRGAYHFFRPGTSAAAQAMNFLATVDLQHGDLPPVLDVEVMDGLSPEALAIGVKTWLTMVEDVWKIKPIVYSNQKFYNQHLAGLVYGYPVWLARYTELRKPDLTDGHAWHFWQYGNRGRLNGIVGDVDFNVFNGNINDLQNLTLCRPDPLLNRMPEPPVVALPAPPPSEPGEPIAANP